MFSSRNFNIKEIANQELPPAPWYLMAACFQMGVMQIVRDILTSQLGTDARTRIISGWRSIPSNDALANAARNSYHLWRLAEGQQFVTANDFTLIDEPNLVKPAYDILKNILIGELYYDESDNKIHYSPFPNEGKSKHWQQP